MYEFIRLTENQYKYLKILLKITFNINTKINKIHNKYNTTACGVKNIGFMAYDEKKNPAGYYGVFPTLIEIKNIKILAAQSGDTMTSPEHRNKGLFINLANETYRLANENGIKLIFGFPNENSYHGFKKKLDWKFYDSMQKFTIKSSCIVPLCEITSKLKVFTPIYNQISNFKLSKYKIDLNSDTIDCFKSPTTIAYILKDKAYFDYKLQGTNTYLIKKNNFVLLIKLQPHLTIGAIGYFEKDKTGYLIETIKELANELLCKKAIITISKNHWLFEYLDNYITPEENLPIGFYLFDKTINPEIIEFTQSDYDTFSS